MKLNIKELRDMIRSALNEQLATGAGVNTVAQGGTQSDEPIAETNDLEKERMAKKAPGQLLHSPVEAEKRKIIKAALNRMPAQKILLYIVSQNSIEWLMASLGKIPGLRG